LARDKHANCAGSSGCECTVVSSVEGRWRRWGKKKFRCGGADPRSSKAHKRQKFHFENINEFHPDLIKPVRHIHRRGQGFQAIKIGRRVYSIPHVHGSFLCKTKNFWAAWPCLPFPEGAVFPTPTPRGRVISDSLPRPASSWGARICRSSRRLLPLPGA